MKIDLQHYEICLLNNAGIQQKIEALIREEFEKYVFRKKINYKDKDEQEDDFKEAYDASMKVLLHDCNDW
jgi:hypothetical protein